MKKIFCLMFVAFIAMAAQAQITWNVKAGFGFSNCSSEGTETNSTLVWKAGVGIEKPLSANWSIMPSLEIAMKGCEVESEDEYGSAGTTDVKISYIQIPVLAAYRYHLNDSYNLVAKAGPYFAYGITGKVGEYDLFDEGTGKRFDMGLDLGVDLEHERYVIGFEYEYGFTSIEEGWNTTIAAAYLTIGYKF